MDTNIANTVSSFRGDGRNKENDPRLVALPRPDTPPPQPVSSAVYQLGPRIRQTERHLDFAIYKDETAHEIPPPIREYYGSNVPALADISSGKKHKYAPHHVRHRKYDRWIKSAARRGEFLIRKGLRDAQRDDDAVSLAQRATGCYEWVTACDPRDVWLWVQDKGYHRCWNGIQKRRFVKFLEWMAPIVREAGDYGYLMIGGEEATARLIREKFETLGFQNLTVTLEKLGPKVLFTPCGEDRHVIHRRDFTSQDRRYIDVFWPEQWAPGEESNMGEMVKEALHRLGLVT
ncbi:hypothetical protein HDV63DRAFT_411383 [Trichoderma sp. SZMC 28014]